MKKTKRKIAFLVPAYNEEAVIGETLKSLLKLVKAQDVFVVNDGSSDTTEKVAKKFTKNVISLYPNDGKAKALNQAIKKFNLAKTHKYIMPVDADTKVDQNFLKEALPVLEADKNEKIACVAGRVINLSHNWITLYRLWEYEIAQSVHKKAQAVLNAVIVCPGCSTVYRAKIFNKTEIPIGTLTEDMDFTFLIHRLELGKIEFVDKAFVITLDPETLADFLKQIDRWYTGFWQCMDKHHIPWGGQTLDAELALLALEGLFNGLVVLGFLFLVPITLVANPKILLIPFLLDLYLFFLPTILLTVKRYQKWTLLKYLPHFYLARIISGLMFLVSFIKVVFGLDFGMKWNQTKRYQPLQKEAYGPAVSRT